MKKIAITTLVVANLLSGMNFIANAESSVYSKLRFPQKSCGDKPTGSGDVWYPVFIDGGNLKDIRSRYCGDAFSTLREETKKSIVILASFTDYNRAIKFARLVGGEVGKPSVTTSDSTTTSVVSNEAKEGAAQKLLQNAYNSAGAGNFTEALSYLYQIPRGTKVHAKAVEKIAEYKKKNAAKKEEASYQLLQKAYNEAGVGNFTGALSYLYQVPRGTKAHAKAIEKIAEYKEKQNVKAKVGAANSRQTQQANSAIEQLLILRTCRAFDAGYTPGEVYRLVTNLVMQNDPTIIQLKANSHSMGVFGGFNNLIADGLAESVANKIINSAVKTSCPQYQVLIR